MEEFLAKGKRSNVYATIFDKKKAVVKRIRPGSEAIGAITDEVLWLRRLNKHKIGPKLFYNDDEKVIIEFVNGKRILDYLTSAPKQKTLSVLREIFRQCRLMDKLKISKEEMQNPYKHILIDKKPVMIDFERCHYAERPQNITQFCQFVMSSKLSRILNGKGITTERDEAIRLLKKYKNNYSQKTYRELLRAMLKN